MPIEIYHQALQKDWDNLIEHGINASLIHFRNYMEYHQNRFDDCSACIFLDNKLVAVFPAEKENNHIYSHRGLTFGGPLFLEGLKPTIVQEMITQLILFYKESNAESLTIHPSPEFYWNNSQNYQELQQILESSNFQKVKGKVYQTVSLPVSIKDRGKIWGKKKAEKYHLKVNLSPDLAYLWEKILIPNLGSRHHTKPTHTLEEISLLKKRFPEEIQLWAVFNGDDMLGGCVTFSHGNVIHAQYTAATKEGKSMRALDLLFSEITEKSTQKYKYLSMGISTDPISGLPNQGLVKWKESWGALDYLTPSWEIKL